MPRAPFDTTATFFNGPSASSPGSIRFFGAARYVPADGIFQVGDGAPLITGWVTTSSGTPIAGWVPSPFGLRPSLADQVAIGAGDPSHWVVYVERVIWGGDDYYRASLAELPLPEECDCGGGGGGGDCSDPVFLGSGPSFPPTDLTAETWYAWECLETGTYYMFFGGDGEVRCWEVCPPEPHLNTFYNGSAQGFSAGVTYKFKPLLVNASGFNIVLIS